MLINITKKDFLWSYISQFIQYGAGLIILPFILKYLSTIELGIWYVFIAITSLISLLDFGFSPIIMRNVSYIFSGATKIEKNGLSMNNQLGNVDYSLLYTIIKTSKFLYRIISLFSFLLVITIGAFYIHNITKHLPSVVKNNIFIAWFIFGFGATLNLYFAYYLPLLQGRGFIKQANKAITYSKLFYILLSIFLLYAKFGLIGIAISYLISSLITRILSRYFFYTKDIKDHLNIINKSTIKVIPTFKILWYNSSKLGLNALGSFLVLQSNTIICSIFLGLEDTARYGLSIQVFSILSTFSLIFFTTYIPLFNQLRISQNAHTLKSKFALSSFISVVIYLFGFFIILLCGNNVLSMTGKNIRLLDTAQNALLGLYLFLNMIHGTAASFITTKNEVPFVKATLASGVAITLATLILFKTSNLGVWSLLIPPFFVGLAYNNWKWPQVVLKDLNLNYFTLMKNGLTEFLKISKYNYANFQFKK